MRHPYRTHEIVAAAVSAAMLMFFFGVAELAPDRLESMIGEDGPIENWSAIFFGISCVGFIVFARRSAHLRENGGWAYFFTLSWALLMFVFVGEEISWGQRIFGIETPAALDAINKQGETNIHNIAFVDSFLGGQYRYLSIMMFATGLLFPLAAATRVGQSLVQRYSFPVAPLGYAIAFVGAYAFGKYYMAVGGNFRTEVRELMMGVAMTLFAWHGALWPEDLFRLRAGAKRARSAESESLEAAPDTEPSAA